MIPRPHSMIFKTSVMQLGHAMSADQSDLRCGDEESPHDNIVQ